MIELIIGIAIGALTNAAVSYYVFMKPWSVGFSDGFDEGRKLFNSWDEGFSDGFDEGIRYAEERMKESWHN